MKGINYKLATFSFAAMLLASCSTNSSDDITPGAANATIVGSEVKSITDAQELASRVYNYKGVYSEATVAKAKTRTLATRADEVLEPTIPAGAQKLSAVTDIWKDHAGDYTVEDGETINGKGMNIQGMKIYIKKGG